MTGPRGFPSWEELYKQDTIEKLPWYWPALDPDLEAALARRGLTSGRFLDQGTGPGTQAIALAERGFAVTAADVSVAALAYAARKAAARGVQVTFAGRFDVAAITDTVYQGQLDPYPKALLAELRRKG